MATQHADLVLEGGGVKGIALAGAYRVIEDRGYELNRVAGTSAGAIVASLLAAGYDADELEKQMREVDYRKFQDRGGLDWVPLLGRPLSVLTEMGIYEGSYARGWLRDRLDEKGVRTFSQLPYDDPDHPEQDPRRRYRLVVMASDVSRGRLVQLPYDYDQYRRNPADEEVAGAVRASMSIPFFFEPVKWPNVETDKTSVLVDGGMLSNFPIGVFDAHGREPRWPTFGVKLSARVASGQTEFTDVRNVLDLGVAMVKTMTSFHDRLHVDQASVQERTIFVDTSGVDSTNFALTATQRDLLYQRGVDAAERFFDGDDQQPGWDWERWKSRYGQT
jgi:NTE family protein